MAGKHVEKLEEPWTLEWKFVGHLGGGGQGETSLVVRNNASERGVLKCLNKDKASNSKARRRMYQEVANLRVLHGAGAKVPKVMDDNTSKFETDDSLFFVMELIEGEMLSEVIDRNQLNVETAIKVALELCETLRVAVKERIVHRDIKPENIIIRSLSPADVVMVDFGIARSESDSSNITEVDETFDNKFISLPERRGPEENKRDPRSDLTGVCAILLYCLTKCVPRDLRDSNNRPPHRWTNYSLEKTIPNEVQRTLLNAFFDRGFSWELDSRFQTVDEITSRLVDVLHPNASVPVEDLAVIANRASARLRKSDRISQIADFKQPLYPLRTKWHEQIMRFGEKLTKSRFYVNNSDYQPALEGVDGDKLESFFLRVGVHNHDKYNVVAYHFLSIGEECSIIRKVDRGVRNQLNAYDFELLEEPRTVGRYTGNNPPPFELVSNDAESTVGRLINHMCEEIERSSSKP